MRDRTKHDRAIADSPAGGVLAKTDRLTDQSLVDVDRAVAPSDVAVVAHASDFVILAISARAGCRRSAEVTACSDRPAWHC